MTIETNGGKQHVTSQAQGNYNTVGASAGIASLLGLNLGNILGRNNGNNCNNNCACSDDRPVTRYDANLLLSLNAKDAEIANLKSDQYTDQKIVEVTQYLDSKINAVAAEMRANKDAQAAINLQQAVYNGTNTATIQCLQNQVAQLMGLTKLVVPNSSVCPGWGNVTITPATTTTTPAA